MTDDEIDPSWLNDRSAFQLNFVHGLRNPAGLHLQYELDGARVFTAWTPGPDHVGFPGFAHGGLMSAVLDDAMGRCSALYRHWVVTARLEVRFRQPAPVGTPLRVEGWITRLLRRALHTEGRALLPDGGVVAEATGTYLPLSGALQQQMVDAWPGFEEYL
ncbi:MAG: PaaI family thioesterase [Candidatus Dormiibacterota bacterium]